MPIRPGILVAIIWIGWLLSWMVAAVWTGRTQKRVATWAVWLSRVLLLVGAALVVQVPLGDQVILASKAGFPLARE
jgi:hypothetical protein